MNGTEQTFSDQFQLRSDFQVSPALFLTLYVTSVARNVFSSTHHAKYAFNIIPRSKVDMNTDKDKTIDEYVEKLHASRSELSRHDKTMLEVKETIGQLIGTYARDGGKLLEVGAEGGWQTIFYNSHLENPKRPVIYDWCDQRSEDSRQKTEFYEVDLEKDAFPDDSDTYDVVVCNQVFEHLKNIFLPISEIHRVLKVGGYLIISVPNMCALHNCVLMTLGQQPTTLKISGSHVRGYAIWSMSKFLTLNDLFQIRQLIGHGLHPFFSGRLPLFFRTYCHTPVWCLRKEKGGNKSTWADERNSTFTTTKF